MGTSEPTYVVVAVVDSQYRVLYEFIQPCVSEEAAKAYWLAAIRNVKGYK